MHRDGWWWYNIFSAISNTFLILKMNTRRKLHNTPYNEYNWKKKEQRKNDEVFIHFIILYMETQQS